MRLMSPGPRPGHRHQRTHPRGLSRAEPQGEDPLTTAMHLNHLPAPPPCTSTPQPHPAPLPCTFTMHLYPAPPPCTSTLHLHPLHLFFWIFGCKF